MMKNRIEEKFKQLKKLKKKAFIPFIMAGDPSLDVTERLVLELDRKGVDIIELGVAFSDPLADGPTIQAASQRAIKNKINIKKIFILVKRIRQKSQLPLALMTYYNPVFRYDEEKFLIQAKKVGVDGIIIPDLIPEEAHNILNISKKLNLANILFLSPTSSIERIKLVSKLSSGFIYYVSLTGVTGVRENLPVGLIKKIKQIKRFTKKPICVGFGISRSDQVERISKIADGIIVGSAIIKKIEKNIKSKDIVTKIAGYVAQLRAPIK
jgi:tryptophan synthase alpha chain